MYCRIHLPYFIINAIIISQSSKDPILQMCGKGDYCMEFLQIILMFVSVVLIILSLLQSGKSDGLSSAFIGSGDLNLFANTKERGPEKMISNATMVVGIFFFALVVLIRVFG